MYTSMMRRALFGSGDTATLSLDLSSGTLPTEITFTRADSTARATFINASGYVQTVASAGDPRFDYTGGVAKGLLIEAAATNSITHSNDLTQSGWFVSNASTATSDVLSPNNLSYASKVTETAVTTTHLVQKAMLFSSGTTYTWSLWAKSGLRTQLYTSWDGGLCIAKWDLSGGTSPISSGSTSATLTQTSYPGGWYRLTATYVSPAGGGYLNLYTQNGSGNTYIGLGAFLGVDSTAALYIWGVQQEVGQSASSLINTTTAALTRLADDAVIRSTAWTGLYSKPGTIVVEYYRGEYGAGDRSVLAIDTAATKHIHLKHANASAGSGVYNSAGLAVCAKLGGNVTGLNKAAFNWTSANPSTIKYALNGNALVVSGTSDIGATLGTWMTIGSASTTGVSGSGTWEGYLNNSIKSVKYYSELLTDAEMIAKTT